MNTPEFVTESYVHLQLIVADSGVGTGIAS